MPGTGKTESQISFLFNKYLNETCSNREAKEIIGILEDRGNDIFLMNEARSYWQNINTEFPNECNQVDKDIKMDQILDRLHHRIRLDEEEKWRKHSVQKRFLTLFSKVAAVLVLPLLIYSIYLTSKTAVTLPKSVWQTIKTPEGMQTDFLLPDGSHVWLNSGSVFKYPTPFDKDFRQVELTGEAYFDVEKDARHPFLVHAGKMNIEVTGTRFNVINYDNEAFTEMILESGSVRLFSGNYSDHRTVANIKPGELASLDTANNLITISKVDVSKYTAWKEGKLIFRDDKMGEVVRKLNRWFNVEIILQSPELKDYVYTATYKDETLSQILELLKISAPIKYSIIERERMPDNSYTKRKIFITKRN